MDMHRSVGEAQIDWVVEPAFAPVLKLCPAVDRIIPCDMRQWRRQWWSGTTRRAWQAFKHDLQTSAYDAVIDLQGLSKSALISTMAHLSANGKRYAMAHGTEGSGYEAPTRWVADRLIDCPWHSHAVDRGRHVCAQAMGYAIPAQEASSLSCTPHAEVPTSTLALVHGSSRADKAWPLTRWQRIAHRTSGCQCLSRRVDLATFGLGATHPTTGGLRGCDRCGQRCEPYRCRSWLAACANV